MELHTAVISVRSERDIENFSSDSLNSVENLVLQGANVNGKDESGRTPLLLAMEGLLLSNSPRGFLIHEKLISFLRASGAYVDDQNDGTCRLTPIRTAQFNLAKDPGPRPRRIKEYKLVLGEGTYYGMTDTPKVIDAVIANDEISLSKALEIEQDASSEMFPTKLTALHFACWFGCENIVKILVDAGASPCAEDHFGLTPLLIASAMGNEPCLLAMINRVEGSEVNRRIKSRHLPEVGRPSPRVDYMMNMPLPVCRGTTLLHEAVKSNRSVGVDILLRKGADAVASDMCSNVPLALAGARLKAFVDEESCRNYSENEAMSERDGVLKGCSAKPQSEVSAAKDRSREFSEYEKIVSMLLAEGSSSKVCHKDILISALINAVTLKSEAVVKLILDRGADPCWKNQFGTSAFHEAAAGGSEALLRLFVDTARSTDEKKENFRRLRIVDLTDSKSSTPLHRAAYRGHRDCIIYLIKSGANLSLKNLEMSAIETILLCVDRPKSFVLSSMDACISCKRPAKWERGYSLELDFSWIAYENDVRQTAVIKSLLKSTLLNEEAKKEILEHPLLEAFCTIKWHRSRGYFFAVVVVHFLFVASLSLFTMFYYLNYDASLDRWANSFRYFHMTLAIVVLLHAASVSEFEFSLKRPWKLKLEAPALGFGAALSIIWVQAGFLVSPTYFIWSTAEGWAKFVLIFMIPLDWMALMLMIGRYRVWGSRALLFGEVLKNVLLTFCVLGLIIVGFSFSFFIMFHSDKPTQFGNPWKSFVSTLIMMTGEYNYSEISESANMYTRFLLLAFVVVASLVINNLVVALAVTDAQSLGTVGEWLCIRKKLEFTNALECMAKPLANRCRIPSRVQFAVSGSEEIGYRIHHNVLPKRLVKALMDIAIKQPPRDNRTGVVIRVPEDGDNRGNFASKTAEGMWYLEV